MVSRFNTEPSTEYASVVRALKKLSLEERHSAFADSYHDDFRNALATQLGEKINGPQSWRSLLGESAQPDDELPADDHTSLWQGNEGLTYVSQPYDLKLHHLREIVRLCEAHGLDVHVDARSWWFPGGTLRLCYRKIDVQQEAA